MWQPHFYMHTSGVIQLFHVAESAPAVLGRIRHDVPPATPLYVPLGSCQTRPHCPSAGEASKLYASTPMPAVELLQQQPRALRALRRPFAPSAPAPLLILWAPRMHGFVHIEKPCFWLGNSYRCAHIYHVHRPTPSSYCHSSAYHSLLCPPSLGVGNGRVVRLGCLEPRTAENGTLHARCQVWLQLCGICSRSLSWLWTSSSTPRLIRPSLHLD